MEEAMAIPTPKCVHVLSNGDFSARVSLNLLSRFRLETARRLDISEKLQRENLPLQVSTLAAKFRRSRRNQANFSVSSWRAPGSPFLEHASGTGRWGATRMCSARRSGAHISIRTDIWIVEIPLCRNSRIQPEVGFALGDLRGLHY